MTAKPWEPEWCIGVVKCKKSRGYFGRYTKAHDFRECPQCKPAKIRKG